MFDKLKELFILEEDKEEKAQNEEVKDSQATTSAPDVDSGDQDRAGNPGTDSRVSESSAEPDKSSSGKFVDVLLRALEEHNQEGFDYLEYKQSIQSLSKVQMDEDTRYKSAYAMAQTMGANPGRLVESAQFYIGVLGKEKNKFLSAAGAKRKSQVDGKRSELTQYKRSIEQKRKQIEQLQKEIAESESRLAKMEQSIRQAAQKIGQTEATFIYAHDALVDQIKKDIEKMKVLLK